MTSVPRRRWTRGLTAVRLYIIIVHVLFSTIFVRLRVRSRSGSATAATYLPPTYLVLSHYSIIVRRVRVQSSSCGRCLQCVSSAANVLVLRVLRVCRVSSARAKIIFFFCGQWLRSLCVSRRSSIEHNTTIYSSPPTKVPI